MKNYGEILLENRAWAEEVFSRIDKKMSVITKRRSDIICGDASVETGLRDKSISAIGWTSGFWGGLNWMLYDYTKNEDYKITAQNNVRLLDDGLSRFEDLYHDVGFMWHLCAGAAYRLTGDEQAKVRNLFAAASLCSRFVLGGNFIRAWNRVGWAKDSCVENWTIVDCMMNLPILYWASDVIGDDRFKRIAMAHADTTIDTHIRPDGSVVHIVEHDRECGDTVATYAGQGSAVGSSWSRGQAWALYGFVLSYLHTGEVRYLDTAKLVANYFIANCCDDWLPRVDFRAPSTPVYYDSTAGACAACGMIELAKILPEGEGGMYINAAINILRAMEEKFTNYDDSVDYILGWGTTRYPIPGVYTPQDAGVDRAIIYGDFFYTEAILKLLGADFNPW